MTTTQTSNQPPVLTIAYGAIKGKVWQQTGKRGNYYKATITKVFRLESGEFRSTTSFNTDELLIVAKIADELHCEVHALMQAEYARRDAAGDIPADIQDEESVETENA